MKKFFAALCAVAMVSCATEKKANVEDITGKWNIVSAMGVSTETAETPAFIEFSKDGQMNGNASVNTFFSEYQIKDGKLSFGPIGMTRMMGRSMDVENAISKAMDEVKTIRVKESKAVILNEKNDTVMVLEKQ